MMHRRLAILFILVCLLLAGLAPVQAESPVRLSPATSNYFWAKGMGGWAWDRSNSIAVDLSGNLYTAGTFQYTADFDPGPGTFDLISYGGDDIFISKLDNNGNLVWAKSIGAAGTDYGPNIAVDTSGNVYTAGYFGQTIDFDPGPGTFNLTSAWIDIFVLKLDSSGNFVWAKSMGGVEPDEAYGIAVDSNGNVYTTGTFEGVADFDPGPGVYNLSTPGYYNYDIFISKLDSNGNFVWAKNIGGTYNDSGQDIAVDNNGNVYTTGAFWGTADFDPGPGTFNLTSTGTGYYVDIFVSKLNSNGDFVWAAGMGGTTDDYGSGIAVDSSHAVYTTGIFQGTVDFDPGAGTTNLTSAGGRDIFVSKLDSNGNLAWADSLGGTGEDVGNGIAVDSTSNVYTTGHFFGTADFDPGPGTTNLQSAGSSEIFVSKLNGSGNFVWAKSVRGQWDDDGLDITADSSGNIYTTGVFEVVADFYPGPGTYNLALGHPENTDIFVYKPENLGVVPAIIGQVANDSIAAGNEVAGAFIQACLTGGGCQVTTSESDGTYGFIDLEPGEYTLQAFPPGGNYHLSGSLGPLTLLDNSKLLNQNIVLLSPNPMPAGTTITPMMMPNDVPTVNWQNTLTLTTTGCSAGTAGYQLFQDGAVIRSGSMIESPVSTYSAVIAPLYPVHSDANVIITLQCPGVPPTPITFNIWIDPSGVVVDTNVEPVSAATVTLYRSDVVSGPFVVVASGSGIMSPANRVNPMLTDTNGRFGWDVIAGYYKVRAEKSGCVAADNHAQPYAQTEVLTIPPPVTDLRLVLYCGEQVHKHVYLPVALR